MAIKRKFDNPPIVASSMSETIINFLDICRRTKVYGDPTKQDIYNLAPTKFKNIGNLDSALERLADRGFIVSRVKNKSVRYFLTDSGVQVPYQLALVRKLKAIKNRSKNYESDL